MGKRITMKTLLGVAGSVLVLPLAIGMAWFQTLPTQSAAAGPSPKRAEEVFKNIQVLRGVPADHLIPTMEFFEASLGVECEFCHDAVDRTLDAKPPKLVARKMLQMMFQINNNTFEGRPVVTCYSCHRGRIYPLGMPPLAGRESPLEPPKERGGANPSAVPTVDQLIHRYVAALGGADAIKKISTRYAKVAVSDAAGRRIEMEVFGKAPDKRLTIAHQADGDGITVFNGDIGWIRRTALAARGQPREMRLAELDAARLEDPFYFGERVKQVFSDLRVGPTEEVGGREAYVILGRTRGLPLVKLYFDPDSGLLVRLFHHIESAVVGRIPTQIDYADYRNSGGVMMPFRWTIAQIRGSLTYRIEEMQQNITMEESKFAKPPPVVRK